MTAPRPQVLSMLQAAREAPDDDTPRLVLADWLTDHGDAHDAARAELIRLQCEEARLPEGDPRKADLAERAQALIDEHDLAWLGPLRPLQPLLTPPFYVFRRGLIRMQADGAGLFAKGNAALASSEAFALVDGLAIARGLTRPRYPKLAVSPFLMGLVELEVNCEAAAGSEVSLGRVFALPLLERLTLRGGWRGGPGQRLWQSATPGPRLRHLGLASFAGGWSELALALADWPGLTSLRSLSIAGYRWLTQERAAAAKLFASPRLAALRSLAFTDQQMHDAGARLLAEAPGLAGLTDLLIDDFTVHRAGAEALRQRFGDRLRLGPAGERP
jgi:uncharacterized protein (TIGR02996 family)